MTTNRNLNKQRRIGIKLALGSEKVDYEDPALYPSFPEGVHPQQLSLLDTQDSTPKRPKKRTNEFTKMEARIMELYKQNKAVADNDQILDVEMWLQEGLQDVLRSGSVEVFLHWLMFEASPAGSIERARRALTSDKEGTPRMPQSEDARQSRAAKERVWHTHWSKKDGGTMHTQHELHRFERRDGIDRHGQPPFD